jgi:transcriptional regulator
MYVPRHFAQQDDEQVRELIADTVVGDLVTVSSTGLTASLVPFVQVPGESHGALHGHLARGNDQWRTADAGTEALVMFRGPDAYITPRWYPAKQEHGRVVPTWNYAVVHVYGRLVVHDDPQWTRQVVAQLTTKMESSAPEPWSIEDAPPEYIERMVSAIVGIEIVISRIEAKWKLSQNQPAREASGVADGLAASDDFDARQVAAMMPRTRPA